MMHSLGAVLVFLISGLVAHSAHAQGAGSAYPARPITLVMSFAPGGPIDTEFRLYTPKLADFVGQPFVADFKPGAGGTLGPTYVARAKPDGYTLLPLSGSLTTAPAVNPNVSFDPVKDFAAISLLNRRDQVIVVHPGFAPKDFREYLAYARANPGKVTMSNSGTGGVGHLASLWLNNLLKIQVTFIPYKGAGPQMADLMGGRLNLSLVAVAAAMPLIKSGKVRPLAVMGKERSKLMPDVPSVSESGIDFDYANWLGVVAPAGTPAAVISKLNDAFVRMARTPDIVGHMEELGTVMVGSSAADFQKLIATEVARWKSVVKENNIKIEQ
jgi:tripartite-type tricarboxylate transporter receptor subunit TctC